LKAWRAKKLANKKTIILVVDEEKKHADGIVEALGDLNAEVIAVYTGAEALKLLNDRSIGIVITDFSLGDIDGLEVLAEAKKQNPQTEVILMTAYASIETCKDAIRQGACDYISKPIDIDQLRRFITQSLRKDSLKSAQSKVSQQGFEFEGIESNNSKIKSIYSVLKRVAPTDIAVLVEGESGTGKELLARAIHNNSNRKQKGFIPVNCAGLTETLLESELFGHVKGAFTGASADRKGLFEIADKGTLFLDEIGDMPLTMQAKLLRVLEDGLVVPVGAVKPIVVDVRVISATNRDLTKLIEDNTFRQDLYFRIKGVSVTIPPLRQCPEDIPPLVEHFAKETAVQIGSKITGMSESALAILMSYDWPGNIRQLKNCIRTMVVMCQGDKLDIDDIPPDIQQVRQLAPGKKAAAANLAGVSLDELEKQAIVDTLAKTKNNREKAAKILGIGERTLYRKIKEYDL
jgi:two-component system response regulator HydG